MCTQEGNDENPHTHIVCIRERIEENERERKNDGANWNINMERERKKNIPKHELHNRKIEK